MAACTKCGREIDDRMACPGCGRCVQCEHPYLDGEVKTHRELDALRLALRDYHSRNQRKRYKQRQKKKMPYSSVKDVPSYVPKDKKKQWLEVFNSAYKQAKKDGKSDSDAEKKAFAEANGVAGPNAKVAKAAGTKTTGFVRAAEGPFRCGHCEHMEKKAGAAGYCIQPDVNADEELKDEPRNDSSFLLVAGGDCCNKYDPVSTLSAEKAKAMATKFRKFIPFSKVDAAKREVWGIVTAEVPDKDNEVCDYDGSKPYYRALIDEMAKATAGKNFFPLREMHQLSAVGKCIGFEFRDSEKEIYMGFKVVDDNAWKKVDEGVYTGFSQGGNIVGDLTPDPIFKGCNRYVADPSECSVVDNPCLGVAHFAYVKADGAVELRKIRSIAKTEEVSDHSAQSDVPAGSSQPQAVDFETIHKEETKRDGVKYLVEDGDKGSLPYTGPDGKPDHRLMGAAWAALHGGYRGNKYSGSGKEEAIARLKHIYEQEGLDTPSEKARKVLESLRKPIRIWVSRRDTRIGKLRSKRVRKLLWFDLDVDLAKLSRKSFVKGMYEVSRLACSIQDLAYMVCSIYFEQEYEQDADSKVAAQLSAHVADLLDTFLEYAEEEASEMKEELAAKA
jgi:hypothetical protein